MRDTFGELGDELELYLAGSTKILDDYKIDC
jgi:hypothetical protein